MWVLLLGFGLWAWPGIWPWIWSLRVGEEIWIGGLGWIQAWIQGWGGRLEWVGFYAGFKSGLAWQGSRGMLEIIAEI